MDNELLIKYDLDNTLNKELFTKIVSDFKEITELCRELHNFVNANLQSLFPSYGRSTAEYIRNPLIFLRTVISEYRKKDPPFTINSKALKKAIICPFPCSFPDDEEEESKRLQAELKFDLSKEPLSSFFEKVLDDIESFVIYADSHCDELIRRNPNLHICQSIHFFLNSYEKDISFSPKL